LKGYDIVLGKLVAGSLNSFYSVFAVLPMMAIPLLLGGGLTLGEFIRMTLVVIDALLFSLALGMCVSSMTRSAHRSASMSVLILLFFVALVPALGVMVTSVTKGKAVHWFFLAPSIGFSYYTAFDAPYKLGKFEFWTSLGIIHAISWLGLLVASIVTRRSWQDKQDRRSLLPWSERWPLWTQGSSLKRSAFRRQLLDINPILWFAARIRSRTAAVWVFLGVSAVIWFSAWFKFKREWLNEAVYVTTAILLNLILRYWLAGEATRSFAEHRKSGALELLLSTPLSVNELLRGHGLAMRKMFMGPVLVALGVETLFMFATLHEAVPDEERTFWLALWMSGMLMLVADLVALHWVGMWQGLTAKNPIRAAGGSLFRILALPWIAYAFVLLMIIINDLRGSNAQTSPGWKFFLGLWFCLGMAANFAFGAWSRQKLMTEFRLAAQERYGSGDKSKSRFWPTKPSSSKAAQPTREVSV
jgi:ABC-type transport system involved in multi-copper enzyme maturation permease subunit